MSGWTVRESEQVIIRHHSSISMIEMTITSYKEVDLGKAEDVTETIWLDYGAFKDLRNVINRTEFP